MLKQLLQKLTRGASTGALQDPYPGKATFDEGLFGVPRLRFERCSSCGACAEACPTTAITAANIPDNTAQRLSLQLGSCIFCGRCQAACGEEALQEEKLLEIAVTQRESLLQVGFFPPAEGSAKQEETSLAPMIERVNLAIFGVFSRSLQLYVVGAGSCGGCEEELAAALGPLYQGAKLGISITHNLLQADAFFVAGPIPHALVEPIQSAYHAAPSPKLVLAAGACAIDGNVFRGSYAVLGAADRALPVDVYIPGCPPTPKNLLHGLLLAMERAQEKLTRIEHPAPWLPQTVLAALRQKPATMPMPGKHQEREESPAPPKTEVKEAAPPKPEEKVEEALPTDSQIGQPRAALPVIPGETTE